ncbi:hypothetical protein BDW75DRAFT_91888 [Aspergillus navahoensis]
MSFQPNSEFFEAASPAFAAMATSPKPAVLDVHGLRAQLKAMLAGVSNEAPLNTNIEHTVYQVPSYDGHIVSVHRIASKRPDSVSSAGPALLHAHGGGFIQGTAAAYLSLHYQTVQATGVPIFTVDYRLAPEHPFPAAVEDFYAAVKWVNDHADEVGVDRSRIAVTGESAGGAIAAGGALMARDRGLSPPLAKQILLYPALDDRTTVPDGALATFATWSYENNITAWTAYLGTGKVGSDDVSPYAAPARTRNFDGLPPTYIDVGGMDIFRDECIKYAERIAVANIDVDLHVYAGVPHAFEVLAPGISIVERAIANRLAAMKSF